MIIEVRMTCKIVQERVNRADVQVPLWATSLLWGKNNQTNADDDGDDDDDDVDDDDDDTM